MNCPSCQAANDDRDATCSRCGTALGPPPVVAGLLLANRYELGPALGKGGMGVVHKAYDRLLKETVAIKLLRPDVAETPDIARRFVSELKVARAISHRNVCRIHDYGEDRGLRYISMAYIEGQDLKELLRRRGRLPVDESFGIAIAIAEGLAAIHDEGVVHRDLKPQNVMIDGRGVVRLMDFGIAKSTTETTGGGATETGKIVGTPEYMSPEQIRGHPVDARSDIYALAIVIHEIFAGTPPFRADTPVAVLLKHLQEPPPIDRAALPAAVADLLARMLFRKDREQRPASAREVVKELEAARARVASSAVTARSAPTLPGNAEPGSTRTDGFAAVVEPRPTADLPRPVTAATLPPARPAYTAPTVVKPPRRDRRWAGAAIAAVLLVAALVGGRMMTARPPAPEPTTPSSTIPAPATTIAAVVPTPLPPVPSEAPPAVTRPTAVPSRAASATVVPPQTQAVAPPPAVDDSHARAVRAQVDKLLKQAEGALDAKRYDDAIALYDQALELQPGDPEARQLRAAARSAKLAAQAQPAPGPATSTGRRLVGGDTVGKAPESGDDKAFKDGFEVAPGMEVSKDTAAAALPGRIVFDVQPAEVKAGERYAIKVQLRNSGRAPIEVASLTVTTVVNGKRSRGGVTPRVKVVAPGQTAELLSTSEIWGDAIRDWAMDVEVVTARKELYKSRLALQ